MPNLLNLFSNTSNVYITDKYKSYIKQSYLTTKNIKKISSYVLNAAQELSEKPVIDAETYKNSIYVI